MGSVRRTIAALLLGAGTMLAQAPPPETCNSCFMQPECFNCHLATSYGYPECAGCFYGARLNNVPSQLSASMLKVAKKQFGRRGLNNHGIEVALLNSALEFMSGPKKYMPGHSNDAYIAYVQSRVSCLDMAKQLVGVNRRLAQGI